jgi:hypothetical protein
MEEAGSGKGGRTYIQEEATATASTRGGRCYIRGGRSYTWRRPQLYLEEAAAIVEEAAARRYP